MAELRFDCTVCRTALSADESQVGTMVRCPMCKAALRVPGADRARMEQRAVVGAAGGASTTTAPPSQQQQRTVRIPASMLPPRTGTNKRYGFNCPYCSSRLEATESMAAQEGQCPTCGNTIFIPILDRYGRLIDPLTNEVIKQDPHPVHAYAAAGERAPKIKRMHDGGQMIECPRCHSMSPITSNNCRSCGMPFTMEGTTQEAAGSANGFCVASLVLGILALPTYCSIIIPVLAVVFGIIGYNQVSREGGEGRGKGMAIWGMVCGGIGGLIAFYTMVL